MSTREHIGDLLHELAPQVLGMLLRRYGGFDACEDTVQEALLAAATQWPAEGVPDKPRTWSTRRREVTAAAREAPDAALAPAPGDGAPGDRDDTVTLLFLCCHPALTPASQVALTLRAVGGLTTAEVAQAFLVPEATMAPRISRAKQRIRAAGGSFRMPTTEEWAERLGAVLHVLYLIFNEGYTASSGPQPDRAEPDGHSQPRRRGRDDPQAAGRARTAGDARRRRPDGPPLPPAHGARLAK